MLGGFGSSAPQHACAPMSAGTAPGATAAGLALALGADAAPAGALAALALTEDAAGDPDALATVGVLGTEPLLKKRANFKINRFFGRTLKKGRTHAW